MAEWISVKDKLPSDGEYLIIVKLNILPNPKPMYKVARYAKNLHKISEYEFDKKDGGGFYGCDSEWGYFKYHDVTHWMPLPTPPKGEEDADTSD